MEVVMVRYGELFLKSEPVMKGFINTLLRDIRLALDSEDIKHDIETYRGRIIIRGDDSPRISGIVSRIFGVTGTSVCTMTGNSLQELSGEAAAAAKRVLKPGDSFAIRPRRSNVGGYKSHDIGIMAGDAVCAAVPGISVDLTAPDHEIFVEAREFGGLVYTGRTEGPGGLPYGTQGGVLSLLSEGIDSPVASWMIMRRGCTLSGLYFDAGEYGGPDRIEAVKSHHLTISGWVPGHRVVLRVADIAPFYDELIKIRDRRYSCLVCKRFMLKVAEAIATGIGAYALVTGENLGQVASQTLANLSVISEAVSIPVLQPLIGMDKTWTIEIARRIGTFENSAGDLGCRVVPDKPSTKAKLGDIMKAEEKLPIEELCRDAVKRADKLVAKNGEFLE